MATKIILDTDIGDDIDDALALGLICRCPKLELVGVTTVFGNATARARQARTVLATAGPAFARVPVAVGCARPMSPQPLAGGWMTTFADPAHVPNQDATCLPERELPRTDDRHGVDFLIDAIMGGDGDVVPVLIGAMTNLAVAMVKEHRLASRLKRIVVMAGEFRGGFAEWNVRCDPEAAAVVFNCGVPVDVIPWHVGHVVTFSPEHVDRLGAMSDPLPRRLHAAIGAWQAAGQNAGTEPAMPHLFDPMAIATMLRPELCQWAEGQVSVELRGERTYGFTTLDRRAGGAHRVAWDADRLASIDFFLTRLGAR